MRYFPNANKRNVRKIIIRDDARTEYIFAAALFVRVLCGTIRHKVTHKEQIKQPN